MQHTGILWGRNLGKNILNTEYSFLMKLSLKIGMRWAVSPWTKRMYGYVDRNHALQRPAMGYVKNVLAYTFTCGPKAYRIFQTFV